MPTADAAIDGSERRPSQRDAILALLSDGQWHHVRELHDVGGFRYSARVHELRAMGYEIQKVTLGDSIYHYRLVRQGQGELFG